MNGFANVEVKSFVKDFSDNIYSVKRYLNGSGITNRRMGEICHVSERTIERYCRGDVIPSSAVINNLITGLNQEYDDIVTIYDDEPVDWSVGYSMTNSITDEERQKIIALKATMPLLMRGKNFPSDEISNRSVYFENDYCLSETEYKDCLSKTFVDLISEYDEYGDRHFIADIDILSKAMLIPQRTLYSYIEGTRTISPMYAFNIITYLGIMPEALLGNFDTFILSNQSYMVGDWRD